MIKFDYCCFTFFKFGHLLLQPIVFDILIHCPGQSVTKLHGGLAQKRPRKPKLACGLSGVET